MEELVEKTISVITSDGRMLTGLLKGFDQNTNVILHNCKEILSGEEEEVSLGLFVVRGSNIAFVGEIDTEKYKSLYASKVPGPALKPVSH